jgi:hypothetical protein
MELIEFIGLFLIWLFVQWLLLLPDEVRTGILCIGVNIVVFGIAWFDYMKKVKQINERVK